MKRYYWFLARLSLGIILIQACIFLYFGCNTGKINSRLKRAIAELSQKQAPSPYMQQVYTEVCREAYYFQAENAKHNWILWSIVAGGLFHVLCIYSVYIYFLRMGYGWTKWCLHLNNLIIALMLPAYSGLVWLIGYVVGTRVFKHFCLVSSIECPTQAEAD